MSDARLYHDLSWMWEILVSEEEYIPEAEFVKKMVKMYQKGEGNELLDVGCGGGHHDLLLKSDFKIVGIDKNENMLEFARTRNPELEYHAGDMRTFQLDRKFDMVIAMDMIMYNLTYDDMEKTLANFSGHLKTGGVMIFFLEDLKENFEQNKTRFKKHQKGDLEAVLVENHYDPDPTDTEFEYHLIFLIREKGNFSIEVDLHRMGLFELDKILEILKRLNFRVEQYELDFSGRKFEKEGPILVCEKVG
ncbi:MAG TPA: class I SAM-dependent methyltransferase [candidate division Zixibacteria bacterium]